MFAGLKSNDFILISNDHRRKVGSNCNRLSKPKVYSGTYGNLQEYRMPCAQHRGTAASPTTLDN